MIALALALAGSFLAACPPPGSDDSTTPPSTVREAGLRGLLFDQGRWTSPDEVVARDLEDSRLAMLRADYAARRAKAPGTAEGQRELAFWCEREGLKAESLAHFLVVSRLDPVDRDARDRLGLRFDRGSWRSGVEIAADRIEAEAQSRADRSWLPRIATWRRWLGEPEHKAEAIKALGEVRDPRAVPAVRRSFVEGEPWEQDWAVKLLGRIDAPRSSQALAELSVFGLDEKVRLTANWKLVGRDPRTFVGLLINWLRQPLRYEFLGEGESELLRVEGTSAILERSYLPSVDDGPTNRTAGQALRLPNAGAIEQGMTQALRERQRRDIRAIERANFAIEQTNARVERTLKSVTGADLGRDPGTWTAWWTGELGYSYQSPMPQPKPVIEQGVNVVYVPPPPPVATFGGVHHSCFGAGTPVLTRMGARPIEALRVGDQVLTQDPTSGSLAFRPILAVFHNKPTATLRVDLEGESIVATGIHRFWKAGQGWAMARDLRAGDLVRTLGGQSEVIGVGRDEIQAVYNLEVADGHSFFVGRRRALVHDNSLVAPTDAPFDAEPVASKSAEATR